MAWLPNERKLAPVVYRVELNNYDILPDITSAQLKIDVNEWVETLGEMWGDLRGWWLSGAVNVSAVTQNFNRPMHTNTDIALMNDSQLLEKMLRRAQDYMLFPFSRISSRKAYLLPSSTSKVEKFLVTDVKSMSANQKKDKNYMLCEVDHNGMIIPENRMRTRIRLFLYEETPIETLVSIEDRKEFSPSSLEYTHKTGRILFTDHSRKKIVFANDIRAIQDIHQDNISKLKRKVKRKLKHQREIDRISQYLFKNPGYLYTKSQEPIIK